MTIRRIPQTPSAYDFPLLIKNVLRVPLIYYPDREIIYRDQIKYTYVELDRRIQRLVNVLTELGVKQGDTVAVIYWDSHRFTINHAKDDVILFNAEFLPLLAAVQDQLKTVKKIILLSDDETLPDTPVPLDGEYEKLLAAATPGYTFPDFDENAMATTFYTTGTTGLPKGVYFSHRQIVLHTYGIMSALCAFESQGGINSGDVYMPMTPMFHVHAWGIPYLCTMLGTKQVYPGKYEPDMLLRLIVDQKVTFSHCVPTIIHMLVSSPAIDNLDLSGWKVLIGGSALSRGLCKAGLDKGIYLYAAYGMSETCPLLTMANLKSHMFAWDADRQIEMRCRTGLPVPNVILEVVDPDGTPLPHDGKTAGEVVVRSPWLTQGYVGYAEKSEALWAGGWLHTGDIGFIDKEGFLQITDRVKDVIKTGGEWISSLELEDIISRHPAVSEAAVIGIPDSKWVERPLALVVLKPGMEDKPSAGDLKAFLSSSPMTGLFPGTACRTVLKLSTRSPKSVWAKSTKNNCERNISRKTSKKQCREDGSGLQPVNLSPIHRLHPWHGRVRLAGPALFWDR